MKLFNLHPKVFLRDRFILISLFLSIFLNLLIWLLLAAKIPRSVEPIVLHYNIYFSIDLIGSWYRLFVLPLTGLIIILFNFFLSYIIYQRSRLVAYFLTGASVGSHLFLLIACLTLIFINL